MTNSMIPYSFIPGTKAKAGEVNANFIALADIIDKNKEIAQENVLEVKELLKVKADKTELINDHTVSTAETDLNDYKTSGTYVFSALYTPLNIPKGESGTLIVAGTEESTVKQLWFCDGDNTEIYTRSYQNSAWTSWNSNTGKITITNPGYLKFPNGLIMQWGQAIASKTVVYPIAFQNMACAISIKSGQSNANERSDTGIPKQYLTGFTLATAGPFGTLNYIAIGF